MIKNVALFFSTIDEKTRYKQLLQYETVHNNEVCVLSGCPYSGVFQQVRSSQKKQRNQRIEFSWGLYCLVVLFLLLYVICASITTEGTIKQGLIVLQKLKIKTWVKSTRHTTLRVFFSYLQDVRLQRSAIHMCRTPKWQHCGVFLW